MESNQLPQTRRTVLKKGILATATAAVGVPMVSGLASATDCCKTCWVDVKPDSCPNSINPKNNGVVSVAVGWPNVKLDSVRLVPSAGNRCVRFTGCQDYRNPDWKDVSCEDIDRLLSEADGRSASAIRMTREDLDGDGDDDTVLKFRTRDLQLVPDDEYLVLEAETKSGCRLLGLDTVRVVDKSNGKNEN
ncbi:twin-arginine translocation signal domain-containing protein [Haladaptatus sp. NG-WS-4]